MSLSKLPPETILEIASYLLQSDVQTLRSTCRYMDILLLETFGKHRFKSLYVLPTPRALDTLIRIAHNKRLSHHVQELVICAAFHQGMKTLYRERPAHDSAYYLHLLEDTALPFPEDWTSRRAVNEAVSFVRCGKFGKKFLAALRNLKVKRIEIQAWPRRAQSNDSTPVLGLWWLKQLTGHDPFQGGSSEPSRGWEYKETDMMTCMTRSVISAASGSRTPFSALVMDKIQIDKVALDARLLSGRTFEDLTRLDLHITSSEPRTTTPAIAQEHMKLITMINNLPRLSCLSLSNLPYHNERTLLPLNGFIPHLRPRNVHTLSLDVIDGACQELPALCSALVAPLSTLRLGFRLYKDFSNAPWNNLFSQLQEVLVSLEHLEISIGSEEYHAGGREKIDQMLQWLARHVQEDWEEDSEDDDDDRFQLWFDEVIDRKYKPRRCLNSPKERRYIKRW